MIMATTKEDIAKNAASTWCRCFKCDGVIREGHCKCDKKTLTTCLQWYHGTGYQITSYGLQAIKEYEQTRRI